jgi:hypothetical protein
MLPPHTMRRRLLFLMGRGKNLCAVLLLGKSSTLISVHSIENTKTTHHIRYTIHGENCPLALLK